MERLLRHGCDVNRPDSEGMTPFAHAVKCNDLDGVVLQLLSEEGKRPDKEEAEEMKKKPAKVAEKSKVDFGARDNSGRTALHHLAELAPGMTFDNGELAEFLLSLGADAAAADREGRTALRAAEAVGAWRVAAALAKAEGEAVPERPPFSPPPPVDDGIRWKKGEFEFDVVDDAKEMLRQLEEEAAKKEEAKRKGKLRETASSSQECEESEEENDDESEEPEVEVPHGCIVKEGSLHKGYAVLMTKVDVNAGFWGLYNFYRMQIWKEKHKDLWILFTNWGRIGDDDGGGGQYQNTPFATAEKAEAEFEKIFRSKSGNDWDERDDFVPKHRKYRLVEVEKLKHVRKSELNFDLKSGAAPSQLPEEVQVRKARKRVKDVRNHHLLK